MNVVEPKEIEKEEISKLSFPEKDVLNSNKEKSQRKKELERAMTLGNLEQIKMKIFFEDDREKRYVNTTIWAVTTDRIVLKQGVTIPIHRISKIM